MKKLCIAILCFLILLFSLTACQTHHNSATNDDSTNNTSLPNTIESTARPSKQQSEEVLRILDREIFILKEETPEFYTSGINDIDSIIAYVQNWKFRDILNEDNFKNISWNTRHKDETQTIITFSGEPRITYKNAKLNIDFAFQNDTSFPIALGYDVESSGDPVGISVLDLVDLYPNASTAFIYAAADSAVSCFVVLLSENATKPIYAEPPATHPPAAEPTTQSPTAEPPATQPPATQPPTIQSPTTQPPATQPPVTEPPLTQEELDQIMLDDAGVLLEFRFETYTPEVTVSGYMRNGTQFVLDNKIALKGYWAPDQWDILEELYIPTKYNLKSGARYTLNGKLRYDELQSVEIIETSEQTS